eukprot:796569-Prymnesium_polylepis.2
MSSGGAELSNRFRSSSPLKKACRGTSTRASSCQLPHSHGYVWSSCNRLKSTGMQPSTIESVKDRRRCVAGWAMNRAGRRAGRLLGACLGAGLLGRWYLLCLRRSVPWSVYFRWTHDDGSTFEYRAHILWIRDRTGLRRTSGERGRVRSACGHHSRVRKCGCLLYTSPSPRDAHES